MTDANIPSVLPKSFLLKTAYAKNNRAIVEKIISFEQNVPKTFSKAIL